MTLDKVFQGAEVSWFCSIKDLLSNVLILFPPPQHWPWVYSLPDHSTGCAGLFRNDDLLCVNEDTFYSFLLQGWYLLLNREISSNAFEGKDHIVNVDPFPPNG